MIWGYDFEVFERDWLVVFIEPFQHQTVRIVNDRDKLLSFWEEHQKEIFVGYNVSHYDQYIWQGIMCWKNPASISRDLIVNKIPGWKLPYNLKKFPIINFDLIQKDKSLKQLEGFQGHSIKETSVPFDIQRPLTDAEIEEELIYCENDVVEALNVWLENINEFNAIMELIREYKLPLACVSMTKAQIVAKILDCQRIDYDDEWEVEFLPCIHLSKYAELQTFFSNACSVNRDYSDTLEIMVAGIPHTFAWGGVHGAEKGAVHYKADAYHLIIHVDVESYYPRLMIWHNLLTRSASRPELFREIFELRMAYKHAGEKKKQAPLKIVINGTFGISKDPKSKAYDPRRANEICVNGQLMLVDLIEHMEAIPSFHLIQSNTDGLIVMINREDFDQLDDVCYEWEERCSMKLAFDYIDEIWQGDVNNYIFRETNGKVEKKGAYVKELSKLDADLPIINLAICERILNGVPVEETIRNCTEYRMFQKICKLTDKFDYVTDGKERFHNKCYRVYASRDPEDSTIYKVKKGSLNKLANTSERSYIENGDVTEMPIPDKLDREWYIDLAKKRLGEKFGIL